MEENQIIERTQVLLDEFATYIDNSVWRERYGVGLKNLQQELNAPCVLAFAGKVKAGKSFLVNALLGVDLAMTGTTETTATINIFKYGTPPYKDKPILCQYIDGRKEWKDKAFLDSLQGTSEASLAQTAKIDRLIFYIDNNPVLADITLVDTPGIGAEVGEDGDSHQVHTDAYFKLRDRHQQETVNLSSSADAMIYLFNTVPTETDKAFLDALYEGGKGLTSLNGIGVLSKIDKDISQVDNIPKFKSMFERELFTIMPTSATIAKYIQAIESMPRLAELLKAGFESEQGFKLAIGSETAFLHPNLPMCKISCEGRKAMLDSIVTTDFSWSTFALIAKELYYSKDISTSVNKLKKYSGIDELKEIIHEHFFKRSRLLRCHKILNEINKLLREIQYSQYYLSVDIFAKEKSNCKKEIESLSPSVRYVLGALIDNYIPCEEEVFALKNRVKRFKASIEELMEQMSSLNNAYLAYQRIIREPEAFTKSELEELHKLLTGKEMNVDYIKRQRYWAAVYNCSAPNSIKQYAASVAKMMYNEKAKLV